MDLTPSKRALEWKESLGLVVWERERQISGYKVRRKKECNQVRAEWCRVLRKGAGGEGVGGV